MGGGGNRLSPLLAIYGIMRRRKEVMTHLLRYEVNCSILCTELPLLERPGAAKAAGFDAVEFWWPFATAVPSDSDVDAFVRSIEDAGVQPVSYTHLRAH